jgi:hydroxymethylpyrimidine/phosphomethylpyrimidine kinase
MTTNSTGLPTALTIAGSDSGGGAGIQADLKTFAAFGVYGTSAITALTAQNTRAVSDVHVVPSEFVEEQIEAVVSDLGCDAVKTGMLATSGIVEVVAAAIESMQLPNLVVDPVMVAKSGDHLLDDEAVHAMRWTLLRLARVVTPNIPEAEVLARMPIKTRDDMREAARRIAMLKPRAVVIKGGHMPGPEVVDLVLEAGTYTELVSARVETVNTHGTGCTFAAAIAAQLAKGIELVEAVREAKIYVAGAMKPGIPLGGGHRPLDHFWRYRP